MGYAPPVDVRNPSNQLCKVEVAHILRDPNIRFNLIKQIPPGSELHTNPSPNLVLSKVIKLYQIRMVPAMLVQPNLGHDLPQRDLAAFDSISLVNELYGKHLAGCRDSAFLDSVTG